CVRDVAGSVLDFW
nr:immunoglobulin heavy chain junction region [Macaca mulatta]